MAHNHRAGRQEAARQRRRRRQLLKIGGAIVGVAIVVAVAMIAVTGGEKDSRSSTAQQPMTNSTAAWEAEAFTGGPRLAVDRAVHDEGPVSYGHEVHAAFQLRNVGDEPLTLDEMSVNTLEGCWPTDPVVGQTTLEPGQETTLHYEFSMHEGMGGPHQFEIVVNSNDAVQPTLSLLVAGEYPKP